jgi:hypothetical protein
MTIVVNHLTRMHGGHICVAGIDLKTRRHVRPVLQHGGTPFYLLARYGGPFDMARVVDLGTPRAKPEAPHVEDCVFVPSQARFQRQVAGHEFWNLLHRVAEVRLRTIFGDALRALGRGRYGTDLSQGVASLGCLLPEGPPELYLAPGHQRKLQVRIRLRDGEIQADAGVTDLRLCGDDHATPDADKVRGVAKWIRDSGGVILSVGLTRKYRPSDQAEYIHYLQVNNIHLKEEPTWQLG